MRGWQVIFCRGWECGLAAGGGRAGCAACHACSAASFSAAFFAHSSVGILSPMRKTYSIVIGFVRNRGQGELRHVDFSTGRA